MARASFVMAPVSITLTALRDAAERASPRNFNGKADNPVSQVLQNADIGWTASRGPISAGGSQDVLSRSTPLNGKINVTGSLTGKATGAVGDAIGGLLGTRTVLNELIAFGQLGELRPELAPRSFTIATFALCGFANFSSIGIQLGGIGALAPDRRSDLARLGFRALLAGTLANYLSACIAGILL